MNREFCVVATLLAFALMTGCNVSSLNEEKPLQNTSASEPVSDETDPESVPPQETMLVISEWPKFCSSTAENSCQSAPNWTLPESDILRFPRGTVVLSSSRIQNTLLDERYSDRWPNPAIRSQLVTFLTNLIPEDRPEFVFSDWVAFVTEIQTSEVGSELWLRLTAAQLDVLSDLVYGQQTPLFAVDTDALSRINASPIIQNLAPDDYQALQQLLLTLYEEDDATKYSWSQLLNAFAGKHMTSAAVTLDGWRLYHETLTPTTRNWLNTMLQDNDQWVIEDATLTILDQAEDADWGIDPNDYLATNVRNLVLAVIRRLQGMPGQRVVFPSLNSFVEQFGEVYGQWDETAQQFLPIEPAYTNGHGLLLHLGDALAQELMVQLLQPAVTPGKTRLFEPQNTAQRDAINALERYLPGGSSVVYVTGGAPSSFAQATDLDSLFTAMSVNAYWLAVDPGLAKARLRHQCDQYASWFIREGGQLSDLAEYPNRTRTAEQQCDDASANLKAIAQADVLIIDNGDVMRLLNTWLPEVEPGSRRPTLEWLAIAQRIEQKQLRILSVGRAAALFSGLTDTLAINDATQLVWNQTESEALARGGISAAGTLLSVTDSLLTVSNREQPALLSAIRFAVENGHTNIIALEPRSQIRLSQSGDRSFLDIDNGVAWAIDLSNVQLYSSADQPLSIANLRMSRWVQGQRVLRSGNNMWVTEPRETNMATDSNVHVAIANEPNDGIALIETALHTLLNENANQVRTSRIAESATFQLRWVRDSKTVIAQNNGDISVHHLRMDIIPE
ncbi:hypothetical protein [Reinekea sp. G2M2-21]|uniref:hypothetical protein n=1 Tax=Reinekea sp. G2M2-21 TaxID=2788942 RepID=UPI0018AB9E3D|nr:hypothetical protein [Reinekea sp. G2M2-21]